METTTTGSPLPIGTRLHSIENGMTMTSRNGNISRIHEIESYDEATGIFKLICTNDDSTYSKSKVGTSEQIHERELARELTRPWNSGWYTICNFTDRDTNEVLKSFVNFIINKYNLK